MASQMLITTAGLAALVDAQNGLTEAVEVTEIGLTATEFVMAPTLVALPGEFKRLDSISGTSAASNIIHYNVQDASTDSYEVFGLGAYLADGTLFAVYAQEEAIFAKSDVVTFLLSFDVAFIDEVETAITFGDATFLFPPATEEAKGAIEIATKGEVDAGADQVRAVTPKTLATRLAAAIAQEASARQAVDQFLAGEVTAAALLTKLLGVDGAGSGLDADMVDGQHGSFYANIPARLGYTPVNKSGDSMSGPLTLSGPPSAGSHAATKAYVDALVTASAILAKLLSVDGPGSGLDADTLDGIQASAFALLSGGAFSGLVSAPQFLAQANGTGEAIKVGDDVWIGDINVPHAASIRGALDPSQGYLVFGNADFARLGRAGSGPLTYDGQKIWHDGLVEQSLAPNGRSRLPNGLLWQWVTVFVPNPANPVNFAWPISFPNDVLAVIPGVRNGLTFSGSLSAYCRNVSNSGGSVYSNNGSSSSSTVNILAIGY